MGNKNRKRKKSVKVIKLTNKRNALQRYLNPKTSMVRSQKNYLDTTAVINLLPAEPTENMLMGNVTCNNLADVTVNPFLLWNPVELQQSINPTSIVQTNYGKMNWSNDMVLQFIGEFEKEPVIWNLHHPSNKKKHLVAQAWDRIQRRIDWECTVEDLKRKRDSLMSYYRIHFSKMKQSRALGEHGHTTNWFAFDALHRFLAQVYDQNGNDQANTKTEETIAFSDIEIEPTIPDEEEVSIEYKSDPISIILPKKRKFPDSAVRNECVVYGELLSHKLMKLNDHNRMIVMHDIDNIIFKAIMNEAE